jgi:hypothetical protein
MFIHLIITENVFYIKELKIWKVAEWAQQNC